MSQVSARLGQNDKFLTNQGRSPLCESVPVLRVWVHLCCFLLSYCTPVQLWGQPCLCNLTEGPLTLDAIVLSDLWFLSLHLGS